MFLVLIPGWWFGYFAAMETLWRGRTIGKAALGLRVVTREGAPVRFRHAAIRTLLGLVDFGLGSGFFAVVFVLFSRDNQRLGDLVAGTLVLRERSAATQLAPVSFDPPPGLESYTATLDVTGMGIEEYQAVRSFLLRARQLAPASRASLAVQLATPLAARLRPPPPDGLPPEGYLRAVAAAYQRRQRAATGSWSAPPGSWSAPPGTWSPPPGSWSAPPGSWSLPPPSGSGEPAPPGSWSPPPPGPGPAEPVQPAPAAEAGADAPTEEPEPGGFAPPA
jgi:RDD family